MCPRCGSRDNATILYGLPAYSAEMQQKLDQRRLVLGGCVIVPGADPRWCCNQCGVLFGLPGEKAPCFTVAEQAS